MLREEEEEDGANFSDMEKRAGFTMKLKSAISHLRRAFVDDSSDANVEAIQQLAKKAKVGFSLLVSCCFIEYITVCKGASVSTDLSQYIST